MLFQCGRHGIHAAGHIRKLVLFVQRHAVLQQALAQLSVFEGGFTQESAEAVLVQRRADVDVARSTVARSRALLADVGLGDRLGDRPEALSAGMRQRAALARTLCEDRPVVLMDEPFGHLDAVTRLELQDLAARLLTGRTVVLVTHDPLEALRLGHHVRVLSGAPFAVSPPIEPPGPVPRDASDPALLSLQGQLIAQLRSAA